MRIKIKNMLLAMAVVIFAIQAWAAGSEGRGGGDLCEDRIQIIRTDFQSWIANGGANNLDLTKINFSVDYYNTKMLGELLIAKIRCVGPGDAGYPVNINGTAKTCIFEKSAGLSQVICDIDKFQKNSETDQYVLIHHEYAGLSGIEIPDADVSTYEISNQISGFLQDQVIKKLAVKPLQKNVPMTFVTIKAGSFLMGDEDFPQSQPRHDVTLTKDFEMQTTVVTQKQWYDVFGNNPSFFQEKMYCPESFMPFLGGNLCADNPVENVSWDDVQLFIAKLNEKDQKYIYRLPTEAEFEYAARAGTKTKYWFSDDYDDTKLNNNVWYYYNASFQTHSAVSQTANPWGLHDMQGHIWQWTKDVFCGYSPDKQTDPDCQDLGYGPSLNYGRVVRGGGFNDYAMHLQAGYRGRATLPNNRHNALGFRLARTAK